MPQGDEALIQAKTIYRSITSLYHPNPLPKTKDINPIISNSEFANLNRLLEIKTQTDKIPSVKTNTDTIPTIKSKTDALAITNNRVLASIDNDNAEKIWSVLTSNVSTPNSFAQLLKNKINKLSFNSNNQILADLQKIKNTSVGPSFDAFKANLAQKIEDSILNDNDGKAILQAILDKIKNANITSNLTTTAIANAVANYIITSPTPGSIAQKINSIDLKPNKADLVKTLAAYE